MDKLPPTDRQAFLGSLSRHIEAGSGKDTTLGILLVDIINLAQINHQYSYNHGDQALCHCFSQMLSVSRIPETVFRIGDHQFVFILPDLKTPSLIALAFNKISKVLKEDVIVDGQNIGLDTRIAIALNKDARYSSEATLLVAESSLMQAKTTDGSFNLSHSENENQQAKILEKIFEDKLKANDFELYYQPKVNLWNGEIESAEALLRWQIPGEGYISPEVAVELAEKTGQSFALTKWVMHTAIRQLKEWGKKGLSMSIAVNVQANLIQEPELFNLVQDSLAIWGIDEKRLTLEITESAIIEDKEAGFDSLLKLKEYGVGLSIDDFGTGYSSLSYFKQIPANELKIDKSFVMNMLTDNQDQEIVKIIVDIAHLFGLKLVAEGIEDEQTYDYLKQLGCDYGQGYYMSKALPADEFYQFLQPQLKQEN
ncbi:MAG: putative bifunctional diguanylate cyclase/phosphodiesterase [Gammaproteobacteria bacterium]